MIRYIIAFSILILSCTNLQAFSYTVKLSEEKLQETINKQFPHTKKKLLTTTILRNGVISLKDGKDRVYIKTDIEFTVGKFSYNALANLNGKIDFDHKKKYFYFKDLEIEQLDIDSVPKKFHKPIQQTVETVAKTVLNQYPVYKLKKQDFKKTATVLFLKDITVKDNVMMIKIGL